MKKTVIFKTAFIALIALISLFILFIRPAAAADAGVDDNYQFDSIEVNITVREDKTFAITEKLTTHFFVGNVNRGIIRDIQRISNTTRIIDGKETKGRSYIAGLSDVSVKLDGGEALVTQSLYSEGEFYSIMMQNPLGYMERESTHVFELSYIYDMSDDNAAGYDDFTFDILGYAMARTEKFNATITFPAGTNLSDTTFRTNDKQVWKPDSGEDFDIKNNVITVSTNTRRGGSGLTVQVILPDGYFDAGAPTFFWQYIVFALIALAAMGAVIYIAFGVNKKPVCPVEFYPPEGMDIMRFSAIWNAGAKGADTAALILKWAGMGIIDIRADGNNDFVLTVNKTKGNIKTPSKRLELKESECFENQAETEYFNTLFSGIGGGIFTFSTAQYRHAPTSNKRRLYEVTERLKKWGNTVPKNAVNDSFNSKAKWLLPYISLVPMLCVMFYSMTLSCTVIPMFFMVFMLAGTLVSRFYQDSPAVVILLLFPASFVGLTYSISLFLFGFIIYDYLMLWIIAPLFYIFGSFVLPFIVAYRTKEVSEDYGKILGFRNFLLTAELPRIQLLFDENPDYFKDILPYCLIMGISDKVSKRFAALKINLPDYIDNGVGIRRMHRGMRRMSRYGAPSQTGSGSGGGGHGGGGGGRGGSRGGGGGGGGSRGC